MAKGGSKPGERRGGRKKGTPNKITADIQHALAALKCDPIVGMAKIALDKKADIHLRGRMFAELAQYIYPKRRAVEITPGKMDPTGAQLVPLDVLLLEYRQLRAKKK